MSIDKIENDDLFFNLNDNNIDNILNNKNFFSNNVQIQNVILKYQEGEMIKIRDYIQSLPPYSKIVLQSIFLLLEESSENNFNYIDFKEISKNKKEEETYGKIDLYIHKKLHIKKKKNNIYCKFHNNLDLYKINKEELNKLISENDNLFQIRGIIFSIYNLIIEYIRSYFNSNFELNDKIIEQEDISEKEFNYLKFQNVYEDLIQLGNWTSDIETDFQEIFSEFRKEVKYEFKLSEFSIDLFLNCIFHIKQINICFFKTLNNNNNKQEKKKSIESIYKIINACSKMNSPFKKNLCQLLNISDIIEKNEKYDLISLIVKNNINNELYYSWPNMLEKKDKIKEDYLIKIQEQLLKTFGEEVIEDIDNNDNNIEENIIKKKEIENNENSLLKKEQKDIKKDNKSVQEWYDYIVDDTIVKKENNKKKNRKKNNKKNNENDENKNNEINGNIIISLDNNITYEKDPIVEQFKKELTNNTFNNNFKIKPFLSEKFIKSITKE